MPKLTIITNTIRRPLELVTQSLERSLGQDSHTSVVLIDQNAVSLQFMDLIEKNPRFSHIHCVVPAVSQARNRAVYSSDTDWLIFCDDDGYTDKNYLSVLQDCIEKNPTVDIFAGSIRRTDNDDFYSKRHAVGGSMKWFWNTKLLMGSNFVIKKSVFEELGKFDEKFGAGAVYGSGEETDLAWNAFFAHKKMLYVPELVVNHVPPFEGSAGLEVKKAFRYGVGKGALIRKWLLRGHLIVFYEFLEMLLVPLIKIPMNLFLFRFKEVAIQFAAIAGRMMGLVTVR